MQNLEKIEEVSSMTIYRVKNPEKVYEVLKKLKLESKYFAILINGKKVKPTDIVEENDEILILPRIAGGK
ncbi:MAG: MoaD/ThiS family protein [Promethearchaeota archaeon]